MRKAIAAAAVLLAGLVGFSTIPAAPQVVSAGALPRCCV